MTKTQKGHSIETTDLVQRRTKKRKTESPTPIPSKLTHHIDDEGTAAGQLGNRMFGRIADIDRPEWQQQDVLLGPERFDHNVPLPAHIRLWPPQLDRRLVRLVRVQFHVHARRAG